MDKYGKKWEMEVRERAINLFHNNHPSDPVVNWMQKMKFFLSHRSALYFPWLNTVLLHTPLISLCFSASVCLRCNINFTFFRAISYKTSRNEMKSKYFSERLFTIWFSFASDFMAWHFPFCHVYFLIIQTEVLQLPFWHHENGPVLNPVDVFFFHLQQIHFSQSRQ